MSFLNNIKIAIKLPLIMLSLSAMALIGMGLMAYHNTKTTLDKAAREHMKIALDSRSERISTWHTNLSKEVIAQSSSPSTRRAITEFISAWAALPGDQTEFLKEHFPASSPKDADKPSVVDFSRVQTDYSRRHRRRHPYYQTVMERNSYFDIFLFDPEGNLVYSVMKKADYATNFVTGTLSNTGLATAYQKAMTLGANESTFVDLAPYGPSNGDVAGFVAAPILSVNGAVMGVYAIQITNDTLSEIFETNAGLGDSGVTMAVGPDYHLRLSSKDEDLDRLAQLDVGTELVDLALSGVSGLANGIGVNGQDVLSAYAVLKIGDLTWAMIAQQDTEELYAPAVSVRNNMLMQGGFLAVISVLVSIFLARSVGRPLSGVGSAMKRVAQEEYDIEIPAVSRGDEIGDIASVLENFRDTLKATKEASAETLFKGTAFEGVSVGLMIVDQDFIIRHVNPSATEMLIKYEDQFKQVNSNFDGRNVIGSNIDIFHKVPERVRDLLNDPANLPLHAEITVGNARFSLDINAVIGNLGEQLGCVVEWQDVTLRRMNDAVLKAIEENQSKAEFSPTGTLLTANENFLNLTGGKDSDQIGKKVSELIKFDSKLAQERGSVWDRLTEGESIVGKFLLDAGEGSDGILEGAFSPVQNKAGKMVRILLVGNDVTEVQHQIEKAEANRLELEKAQAEVVEALRVGMRQLSEGDLTAEITRTFKPDYEQLRNDFNGAVGTLRDAMLDVVDNAESIRGEASDISNAADDLSRRTERQAAALEETATALDELTVSVRSAADGAEQANQVVADAKENAESSGNVVREAVDAMGEIQSSSSQISRIISVIDDIAFQTNLLALNAGVEAARAGEAGRGFAVVASEVRALAQRSSDAAREINDLISASGQHVKRGVDLVGRAGEALGEIFESVSNISNHVSEIAISSSEQSSGLAEINTAVNQLDQVTQQNAAMFEETTAASHALTREAEILSDTMSRFQTGSIESNIVAPNFQSARDAAKMQDTHQASVDLPRAPDVKPSVQAVAVAQTASTPESEWEDF